MRARATRTQSREERRARPFPYACRGSRSEQPGRRESRGLGPGGGEGGRESTESCGPPAREIRRESEAGFRQGSERPDLSLRRGKSIALGVRERSRSAHPLYAAPTRPPVRVSGSHTRPTWGSRVVLDPASEPCLAWSHELPVRSGRWGLTVGSSAEHRRPLPGPVLLCQPCGGHLSELPECVVCERLVRRA